MGPLEATKPWSMAGVDGVRGFLDRVWRLIVDDRADELTLNAAVQDVAADRRAEPHAAQDDQGGDAATSSSMSFNTAIARMMEFTNFFTKESVRPQRGHGAVRAAALALRPAPRRGTVAAARPRQARWPTSRGRTFDEALTKDAAIEIPVQINGKLRGKVIVPAGSDQATIVAAARADASIAELLAGKEIVKTIVVPGKLVNFVVK